MILLSHFASLSSFPGSPIQRITKKMPGAPYGRSIDTAFSSLRYEKGCREDGVISLAIGVARRLVACSESLITWRQTRTRIESLRVISHRTPLME